MFYFIYLSLIFLIFVYAYKLKLGLKPAFYFNLFIAVLVIFLSYIEVALLTPDNYFVRLDEMGFLEEAQKPKEQILSGNFRYMGYLLYSHFTITNVGEWALKIQSIPFTILTSLVLYDATRSKQVLWLFPVVFIYIFFLGTLNMRDAILIFGMMFFSLYVSRAKTIMSLVIWSGAAIIFFIVFRPEFSAIWVIICLWLIAGLIIKNKEFSLYILPSLLLILLFVLPRTQDLFIYVADYFYPGRAELYLMFRSEEVSNLPFLNENASAFVRQLITPLPTSILSRIVSMGGVTPNLFFKEIFRFILMSSVYIMTAAVIFKFKNIVCHLKKNKFLLILFLHSVVITIVYVIYGDGGGATRNKVYPYLFLFILFNELYKFKWNTIK